MGTMVGLAAAHAAHPTAPEARPLAPGDPLDPRGEPSSPLARRRETATALWRLPHKPPIAAAFGHLPRRCSTQSSVFGSSPARRRASISTCSRPASERNGRGCGGAGRRVAWTYLMLFLCVCVLPEVREFIRDTTPRQNRTRRQAGWFYFHPPRERPCSVARGANRHD